MPYVSVDLTLIIALWGALLSTALAIREYVKDRPKVKLTCQAGFVVPPAVTFAEPEPEEVLTITAVNVGHRQVQISGMGLSLSNDMLQIALMSINGDMPLPKLLTEGESVSIVLHMGGVIQDIEKARRENKQDGILLQHAYAEDSTGKKWTCSLPKVLRERGYA